MDCLVCHEQTGTYKKFPTGAGHPVQKPTVFKGNKKTYNPPDWNKVAQSVGRPTRTNCGTCHFYGGGGDGVKHGDIDSSLAKPNKALDVHMGLDGQNFDCVRCHTTTLHNISGRTYATPAATSRKSLIEDDLTSKIMCESCHSSTPHKPGVKANDHTDKVACQSCHIPEFARVNATKMSWDWSKAGQKKDGKPFATKGPHGKPTYNTKKGRIPLGKRCPAGLFLVQRIHQRHYRQGHHRSFPAGGHQLAGGEPGRRKRPYFPVQGARRQQPYDKINKTLLIPKLFGKKGLRGLLGGIRLEKGPRQGHAGGRIVLQRRVSTLSTRAMFSPSPTWWRPKTMW